MERTSGKHHAQRGERKGPRHLPLEVAVKACPKAVAVAAKEFESAAAAPLAQSGQLTLEKLHATPCQLPHQAPLPLPLSGCCSQSSSGQCARPTCTVHEQRAQGCQKGTHQQEEATGQDVRGAGGCREAAAGGALPGDHTEFGQKEVAAEMAKAARVQLLNDVHLGYQIATRANRSKPPAFQ